MSLAARRGGFAAAAIFAALFGACVHIGVNHTLVPVAENGWTETGSSREPVTTYAIRGVRINVSPIRVSNFGMAGPILPIIPIGSSAGNQIDLIIHVTTTSSGVDVEPHRLRVDAPCKLATIAENDGFPDPNVVVHSKSNAGSVRLRSNDTISLLVLLDAANLERCRLSLGGVFARAGLVVPDLTLEERTTVAFDTWPG